MKKNWHLVHKLKILKQKRNKMALCTLGLQSPRQDSEGNWRDLYCQWAVPQPSDDDDNDNDDHDDNQVEKDNVMILIAIDLLQ